MWNHYQKLPIIRQQLSNSQFRLQEIIHVNPGECVWFQSEGKEETTNIALHYIVPIMGYVAVAFKHSVTVPGYTELKKDWLLPASILLKRAKASLLHVQFPFIPLSIGSTHQQLQ